MKSGQSKGENVRYEKKKAKIGIKLKLLGLLLPVVVGMITLIVVQVYGRTKELVLEKSESVLTENTQSVIHQVETWMKETMTALVMERDTMIYCDMDEEELLAYVKHTADQYESFPAGIYVATKEGKLIHGSFVPGPDFDVFEKSWYQDGIESEDFIYGSVYFDEDSQSYVVGASGQMKDQNGKVNGVAAADIYLSAISDIVKEVKLEDTGRMFLIDSNTNMIIGHPDDGLVGKNLDEMDGELYSYISGRIKGSEMGLMVLSGQDGADTYVEIEQIPDSNWITVAYVPQKEILAGLTSLTKRIIVTAVVGCILVVILMERMIHVIVKPVRKLSGIVASITDGDFTVDVPVKTSDEIGVMADGVRRFITTMRGSIGKINHVSEILNGQAEESQKMSEDLLQAANGQALSMQEMAHTISELTTSITEVAESATSLSLLVSDTKEKGDLAGEQMKEAVSASDSGKDDMERVIASMTQISGKMETMEQCAEQMSVSVQKVDAIVGMIGEIAEETNLLSLNASIEAARAGEAGRGFAVVADQIGKLASTSKESVDEIADLTKEIGNIVRMTVQETRESADVIRESSGIVEEAGKTFEQIYQSVSRTDEAVNHMIDKIREVSEIAVGVAGITEEQSAASEEILATTETVKENTSRVSDSSRDVEVSAGHMDDSAKLLGKEMGRFHI